MTCASVRDQSKFDSRRQSCYSAHLRSPTPNLSRLDLVSLRLIVLCAELGSLSAAAAIAHLSVSGASHRLGRIEETFGAALFLRHRRGLTLTKEGGVVATHADLMLSSVSEMAQALAQLQMKASPASQYPVECIVHPMPARAARRRQHQSDHAGRSIEERLL